MFPASEWISGRAFGWCGGFKRSAVTVQAHLHSVFGGQLQAHLALVDGIRIEQPGHQETGEASHQDGLEDEQILGERKRQEHG